MRCCLNLMMGVLAVSASGCFLASPTSFEQNVPAEFKVARALPGRLAVIVQGGPDNQTRQRFSDILLRELESKAGMRKNRLVPTSQIDALRRQDEHAYLGMTSSQIGAAVGVDTVLVVRIMNYSLYPLPLDSYYDCSITVSAMLVDVPSGTIVWPQDGVSRQVQLVLETQRGDAATVGARMLALAAHGVVRYLYDCPKRNFRVRGEKRGNVWDEY
ncbi:MAG TPA: hypothetical protein VLH60_05755 [Sedimentisphaerales bacterium]|nr:hypothetical protein [Sedimentisphaerales bacterium]